MLQIVKVERTNTGGYRGTGYNPETGRLYEVNIDRYGNTNVFNY